MSEQKSHKTQIIVALIGAIAIIIAATIGIAPKLIESTTETINPITNKTNNLLSDTDLYYIVGSRDKGAKELSRKYYNKEVLLKGSIYGSYKDKNYMVVWVETNNIRVGCLSAPTNKKLNALRDGEKVTIRGAIHHIEPHSNSSFGNQLILARGCTIDKELTKSSNQRNTLLKEKETSKILSKRSTTTQTDLNNNSKIIVIPYSNKESIFIIESFEAYVAAEYDEPNKLISFHNWGYINSQEKIINTSSSTIYFKYRISNDRAKDRKGKVWRPHLSIVLSERTLSQEKRNSLSGIKISLPSNENNISISSKYSFNYVSDFTGVKVFEPGKWHEIIVQFQKDAFTLTINNKIILKKKNTFSEENYHLVLKSSNSADFQIKDLRIN